MTTTHSRAESVTLTAVAATMQAADLEAPVAECCGTCYWWREGEPDLAGGLWGKCAMARSSNFDSFVDVVQDNTLAVAWANEKTVTAYLSTSERFACNQWQAKE